MEEEILQVAIAAAKRAGKILLFHYDCEGLERILKEDQSFVTKADKEAETAIVEEIRAHFPEHGIVGEEGGERVSNSEYSWVIDPLDGTSNFINWIPLFAVSIAVLHKGEPVVAVVYNPIASFLCSAAKGKGTFVNGERVVVSTDTPDMGLVTFGPGKKGKELLNKLLSVTESYFKSKRYLGCTALELAYVARGGTEGFVCLGLNKWDYAAGILLVKEAGGMVTDFSGKPCTLEQNYFLASNGLIHDSLVKMVGSVS
jgi:myo-inositol-1(or 4)-monophosphatase